MFAFWYWCVSFFATLICISDIPLQTFSCFFFHPPPTPPQIIPKFSSPHNNNNNKIEKWKPKHSSTNRHNYVRVYFMSFSSYDIHGTLKMKSRKGNFIYQQYIHIYSQFFAIQCWFYIYFPSFHGQRNGNLFSSKWKISTNLGFTQK